MYTISQATMNVILYVAGFFSGGLFLIVAALLSDYIKRKKAEKGG